MSFANHSVAFYLYHIFVYLILLGVLSPSIFYLGRLLPFVYSMLQKNRQNYGLKVGYLYFLNTLGTFVGAIFLGYLSFHLFGLKAIYLLTLSSLLILGLYFLGSRWLLQGLVGALTLLAVLVPFSRKYHQLGLFRTRAPTAEEHFQGIVSQTNKAHHDKREIVYFKDGPNATVAVLKHEKKGQVSKAVIVNGKSDGNSAGDYGTVTLMALVPYLATKGPQLKTMTIGIGTGLSAGLFSALERVSQVDVVEISDAVIESVESMSPENLNFHTSPKTTIYQSDAFQLLKSVSDKYHIILSEPPNPWVVGVENLYTPYFYELAQKRLVEGGIFVQWVHIYSISPEIISTILSNLKKTFANITVFVTGRGDIAFFSSNRVEPFQIGDLYVKGTHSSEAQGEGLRFGPKNSKSSTKRLPSGDLTGALGEKTAMDSIEPMVREVLHNLRVERVSDLRFYVAYNNREVDAIIETNPSFIHDIFYPKLNQRSYFHFYGGRRVAIGELLDPMYRRMLNGGQPLFSKKEKKRWEQIVQTASCEERTNQPHYPNLPCLFLVKPYRSALKNIKSSQVKKYILAYSKLRDMGLIERDIDFFRKAMAQMPPIEKKKSVLKTSGLIIGELLKEGEYELVREFVQTLESKGFIDKKDSLSYLKKLEDTKNSQERLLEALRKIKWR